MRVPRITFRKPWGRTYAYNALPKPSGVPERDAGVKGPIPQTRRLGGSSVVASRRIVDGPGAAAPRPEFGRTDDELQTGAPPQRITRATPALDRGYIGPGTGSGANMDGWPYDGGSLFMPHTRIPRKPVTISPFARTIDPGVTVPSIPIGGPVE